MALQINGTAKLSEAHGATHAGGLGRPGGPDCRMVLLAGLDVQGGLEGGTRDPMCAPGSAVVATAVEERAFGGLRT